MASGTIHVTEDSTKLELTKAYSYTGSVYYRKVGRVVTVWANELKDIQSGVTMGTLPAGYRPPDEIRFVSVEPYPAYDAFGMVRIYGGGALQIAYNGTFPSSGISFCISYVA